jgi:NDP-sugar pyrophosphorylase family protein
VGLGVIVVFGADRECGFLSAPHQPAQETFLGRPLACVEVLGRAMVERTVEQFFQADVELVTVLAPVALSSCLPPLHRANRTLKVKLANDIGLAVRRTLNEYSQNGIEYCFVVSGNLYAETDLLDFFFFHREALRPVSRAADQDGSLDLWVVDTAKGSRCDAEHLLAGWGIHSYLIGGYVRRLQHPGDLRRLIADTLTGRCAMRPSGREVKPGIWIDEGAEIDRRARIVSPAYVGRGSRVQEDALITRCSSIERNCRVDYGTVIEDSSILANTSVGIWLDVRHAIASGDKLFSLAHGVAIEISDPSVLQATANAARETALRDVEFIAQDEQAQEEQVPLLPVAAQEETRARTKWQLGANFIQG